MTTFINFCLLISSFAFASSTSYSDIDLKKQFNEFVNKYNKSYSTSYEYEQRCSIFAENLKKIEEHNLQSHPWKQSVNRFADLTQTEFKSRYASGYSNIIRKVVNSETSSENINIDNLPANKDWRDSNVITDVKDQGMCGSCWAFATVEQLESYLTLETKNNLTRLSAQQITSCSPNPMNCGGTGGCSGSIPEMGFTYSQMMGIVTEEEYPYISGDTHETEECYYDAEGQTASAYNRGYETLPHNDYNATINHLANVGPLAVIADAYYWSFYSEGVFDGCPYNVDMILNHAAQLVGYGTDPNYGPYWLVRNSWGIEWGDKGYIKLKREPEVICGTDSYPSSGTGCKNDGNSVQKVCGMCGILFDSSYPIGTDVLSGIKP